MKCKYNLILTRKVFLAHSYEPNYKDTIPLTPIKGDRVPFLLK